MRAIVALALVAASPVAAALAQGSSLKDQLVGQWQLVSIGINNAAPYGDSPTGSMLLDASGHYSIIVISNGGARNISYYGTYTVDEAGKTINFRIEGSSFPNWENTSQKRLVTALTDEVLTYRNPTSSTPGQGFTHSELVWKRLK